MAKKKEIKKYVISTKTFESLDDVKEQIREWADEDDLRPGTRVFRVVEVFTVTERRTTEVNLEFDKSYPYEG